MRWLIALRVAGLALAGTAAADTPTAALCSPIQGEWESVASGNDLAAMDREIAKIPPLCATLKAQALRQRAAAATKSTNRTRPSDAAQYKLPVYQVIQTITDTQKAEVEELRHAAAQGNADATYRLGLLYASGEYGVVDEDDAEAARLFKMAADKGDARAQEKMGEVTDSQDEKMRWYRLAAAQDNADAEVFMGGQADDAEAARWYRMAADNGSAAGSAGLGDLYSKGGSGLNQDNAEALRWYLIAEVQLREAKNDDTGSNEEAIAQLYEHGGHGLTPDLAQARIWFTIAASSDDDDAKQWLAAHPH